jgi:hypothetical protein
MAADWIKMRRSLLTDPRVVRISSALNADRLRTIGGLFAAWCLFDEHTTDGRLEGYSPEVFDEIVGCQGLAAAMQSVGWMRIDDNSLEAVGFSEHNGQTAKRRAQESVRKTSARNADTVRTKSALEKRREDNSHAERVAGWWDDQAFSTVWARWGSHLYSLGKPMTAVSAESQLMQLDRVSDNLADRIAIVEHSLQKGARNLIIDGGHRTAPQPAKARASRVPTAEDLANYDPNGNYD